MFQIIVSFMKTQFSRLYPSAGILLTYGKHFHDRINSLRRDIWAHKTSLTPSLFIYFCVRGSNFVPLSTIFLLDFRNVSIVYSILFYFAFYCKFSAMSTAMLMKNCIYTQDHYTGKKPNSETVVNNRC